MTGFIALDSGPKQQEIRGEFGSASCRRGLAFHPCLDSSSIRMEVDCIGQLHYVATLVDAHGVTIDVEIEPEFGAELYETMTNSW